MTYQKPFDIKLKENPMKTRKLIVLSGISGSGKTTWAKNYVLENRGSEYLERDIIRRDYFNIENKTVLSKEQENEVTRMQRQHVRELFDYGFHTIIISDTNLSWKYVNKWKDFAQFLAVEFEHKTMDVSLKVALERNLGRLEEDRVPESVIKKQYKRFIQTFGKTEERPLMVSSDKIPAFVFDLDGTVQLMNHRSPFDGQKSYKDFPNMSVIIVLQGLMKAYPEARFIALSGREHSAFYVTYKALLDFGIAPDKLWMREQGDFRSDDIVKKEIYENDILPYFNVIAVFDDREQVVSMVRDELGLHCFQVADGDF